MVQYLLNRKSINPEIDNKNEYVKKEGKQIWKLDHRLLWDWELIIPTKPRKLEKQNELLSFYVFLIFFEKVDPSPNFRWKNSRKLWFCMVKQIIVNFFQKFFHLTEKICVNILVEFFLPSTFYSENISNEGNITQHLYPLRESEGKNFSELNGLPRQ